MPLNTPVHPGWVSPGLAGYRRPVPVIHPIQRMISLRLANQLLAGLPDNDYGILVTDLHVEYLDSGTALFNISQTVTHAHFPAGAAISLVVMMPHGPRLIRWLPGNIRGL